MSLPASPPSNLPPLSRSTIFTVCGGRSAMRGQNYYRQGRVGPLRLEVEYGNLVVLAQVEGGASQPYEVAVTLVRAGRGLHIMGHCSCPMRYNCKHVAAVCFAYQQYRQHGPEATDPVGRWLNELATLTQPPALPEHREALLYLLDGAPRGAWTLELQLVLCRRLKRGGYGKPRPARLHSSLGPYGPPAWAEPIDQDIATLLQGPDPWYDTRPALRGELAELALLRMIGSGRCHWQGPDQPPLRLAPPEPLTLGWQSTPQGRRLRPELPDGWQLFIVHRPLAVDPAQATVRLLESRLSGDALRHALNAPPVPSERLAEVAERLVLDYPTLDLPLPAPTEARRETVTGPPQPVLYLHDTPGRGGRYAELRFRYGAVELAPAGPEAVSHQRQDKVLYRIERDLPAEQAAIDTLGQHALVMIRGPELPTLSFAPAAAMDDKAPAEQGLLAWLAFQEQAVPALRAAGWQVEIPAGLDLHVTDAEDFTAALEDGDGDWFRLSLGVEVDGERINLLPALLALLRSHADPHALRGELEGRERVLVPLAEGHWLRLPGALLVNVLDTLLELYDSEPLDEAGRLPLSRHAGAALGELLDDPHLQWRGADELRELAERLRRFDGLPDVAPPAGLQATLRPYQRQGLAWLGFLREFGFHGVLADDMGLGKTVQTLAHLLAEKEAGRLDRPCLVVAPTSLMGNWRREAQRFTPDLRVLVLHGPQRRRHFERLAEHDLILTTYPLVVRDEAVLAEQDFHYLVLDEAQAIKNPRAKTAQALGRLTARHRLCLTGTPLENHLGELWALFHFLMPGFLGSRERFNRLFRHPVERHGDDQRLTQLRRRVGPFLLRRTKEEVADELPPKTEIVRTVPLEGRQRELYESIRLAMDEKLRAEIRRKGLARSHIMILDALLKLRQVCCDPRLVRLERARRVKQSAKLDLLMELLPEMVEEGRRVLLFSQFTRMLGLIEAELKARGIGYSKLTGQTRKRQEAIDRFQDGAVPVFLISLKAGGVGLNLTAADTVIHYDPWWNPAVERQATDRAHRIGQDKHVFVYKLVTEDTVEERILALQKKKQALAEGVHGRAGRQGPAVDPEELMALLEPLQ